ncbi:MAG TPA: hypothetical protein VKR06_37545 [Ktedonosporobacter sp.]|nr:hypothetical protein [Ktedonosporobacter sp.]
MPRIVAPQVFLFLWILLGLLLASTVLTWLEQVPTRVEGSGIVLDQNRAVNESDSSIAVVFLPAESVDKVHNGQFVQAQVGAKELSDAVVLTVEPGIKSPNEIKLRYGQAIAEPAVVAIIGFRPALLAQEYAGTLIHVQVLVGTQRMLSLLPGVGRWIGV